MKIAFLLAMLAAPSAFAAPSVPVTFLNPSLESHSLAQGEAFSQLLATNDTRKITVQLVRDEQGNHAIARVFSKRFHKYEAVRVEMGEDGSFGFVNRNYLPSRREQDAINSANSAPRCPDNSVEFIAFAPNNDALELQVTREVAAKAKAKGLKVVSLLKGAATRAAYLNYMSCPNLKGNFYDGDANPSELATADGFLTNRDFSTKLRGAFRYRVTNIWLACEAYNNPILSSVKDDAESQKYVAGVNDLLVGPSDRTAACAMEAGLDGQSLSKSFDSCRQRLDDPADQWGFGGAGADYFTK